MVWYGPPSSWISTLKISRYGSIFRWVDAEACKAVEAGSESRHSLLSLREEIIYDEEVAGGEWMGREG